MADTSEEQSGFLFQESSEGEATQQAELSPSTPDAPLGDESADNQMHSTTAAAGIEIDQPHELSEDGYEDQPIGSPNSQLKWAGDFDYSGASPVDLDGPKPVVSDLFQDDPLTSSNLEGKDFFDSFTSGGETSNFMTPPQSLGTIDDSGSPREDGKETTQQVEKPAPQSLSALEGQEGLIMSVDLGSNEASQEDQKYLEDAPQENQEAVESVAPHRELFSTLSLEEDDNQTSGQADTQSIDLLLDEPEPGSEVAEEEKPSELVQDQTSTPDTSGMTLLEQSKLATSQTASSITPSSSEQKLSADSNAGVIHTTGPHPLSPQSPPGVISPVASQPEQLPLDTSPTSPAGIIQDTSPHQLTPQSPQETLQQIPLSSEPEPPRTSIFSPIPVSPQSHPFSLSQEGEDPFAAALSISESDRRHDAWLSSEATQRVLATRLASLHGTEYVDRKQLTMPGVIADEPQVSVLWFLWSVLFKQMHHKVAAITFSIFTFLLKKVSKSICSFHFSFIFCNLIIIR